MRLFTALLPTAEAADDLAAHLATVPARFVARPRWHITLCFYGDDHPSSRLAMLRAALTEARAPRLRLAGSGCFGRRVYFAGVTEHTPGTLGALATACGAGPDYQPHLTLARRRPRGDPLVDYRGPWFTPRAVVLLASVDGRYTPLARFALRAA